MIRHVTLLSFKDSFTQELVDSWSSGLTAVSKLIPGLISITHGRDVLPNAQPGVVTRMDYAIVIDCDSVESTQAYLTHPDHLALTKISVPNCHSIVSVDLEL